LIGPNESIAAAPAYVIVPVLSIPSTSSVPPTLIAPVLGKTPAEKVAPGDTLIVPPLSARLAVIVPPAAPAVIVPAIRFRTEPARFSTPAVDCPIVPALSIGLFTCPTPAMTPPFDMSPPVSTLPAVASAIVPELENDGVTLRSPTPPNPTLIVPWLAKPAVAIVAPPALMIPVGLFNSVPAPATAAATFRLIVPEFSRRTPAASSTSETPAVEGASVTVPKLASGPELSRR